MDLIQHMKKLLGTEHPYDKAHRLKVECTDGITLTGKFVTVVGALDNEPEIAELIIRRDDNGDQYPAGNRNQNSRTDGLNHQGFNPRWFFHTHFSMKGAKNNGISQDPF